MFGYRDETLSLVFDILLYTCYNKISYNIYMYKKKISYILLFLISYIYSVPLKFVEKTVYCLKHGIGSKCMYHKVGLSMCFCSCSVLGVPRDATDDDIRKQYRKLAVLIHPDKVWLLS